MAGPTWPAMYGGPCMAAGHACVFLCVFSRVFSRKSPVRAEIIVPEAQIFCVESFLRDLFNTPGHGCVCWGEPPNRASMFCYVCLFYGNRPLEPRFSTQKLIFCVCRDLGEMCLTYQATWAGVPPPNNRCWSSQKQAKVGRKHPKC